MIGLILNIVAAFFIISSIAIYVYRNKIRQYLYRLSTKLQLGTLRTAIHDADKAKATNNRKNIVVFNSVGKQFEPIEKQVLKRIADKNRISRNSSLTKFRKKNKAKGKRILETERVKTIEEKSLYVTK